MKTTFKEINLDAIEPDPDQPRTLQDQDVADDLEPGLAELAASIKKRGVLEPIIVRPLEHGKYLLVAGERRWRASGMAKLATIPALITTDPALSDDSTRYVVQIEENLQRRSLTPLELGAAAEKLIKTMGITANEVAEMLHVSPSTVSRWRTALDPQHADRLASVRGNVTVLETLRGLPQSLESALLQIHRTTGRTYSERDVRRVKALGAGAKFETIEQTLEKPEPTPRVRFPAASARAAELPEAPRRGKPRASTVEPVSMPLDDLVTHLRAELERATSGPAGFTSPPAPPASPGTVEIERLELPEPRARAILAALGGDSKVPLYSLGVTLIKTLRGTGSTAPPEES